MVVPGFAETVTEGVTEAEREIVVEAEVVDSAVRPDDPTSWVTLQATVSAADHGPLEVQEELVAPVTATPLVNHWYVGVVPAFPTVEVKISWPLAHVVTPGEGEIVIVGGWIGMT